MSKRKRRRFSGDEKVKILKRHLLEGEPISVVCKEFEITPKQFYDWQKLLFDKGSELFNKTQGRPPQIDLRDQKILDLEAKLSCKNEVLSEAVEALITAKKLSGDR
ncbi:MAG: transposase [Verrucomicrobiales bacterium]|nr:transposase [Verrucomicrobiales bacterium]